MENELQIFEQQNVAVFRKLAEFKKAKEEMEAQEKKIKEDLQRAMEKHGITSFKNDVVTLSYVDASETVSLDTKTLADKEPKLYAELLNDYKKVTNKKAYVRITVK